MKRKDQKKKKKKDSSAAKCLGFKRIFLFILVEALDATAVHACYRLLPICINSLTPQMPITLQVGYLHTAFNH